MDRNPGNLQHKYEMTRMNIKNPRRKGCPLLKAYGISTEDLEKLFLIIEL